MVHQSTKIDRSGALETGKSPSEFFNWAMAVFSAPFSAAGIYGFLRHWVDFGIGPVSTEFLQFYETMVVPIFALVPEWIVGWVGWDLPQWYVRLLPLSFIGASAVVRAIAMFDKPSVQNIFLSLFLLVALTLTGSGFLFGLLSYFYIALLPLAAIFERGALSIAFDKGPSVINAMVLLNLLGVLALVSAFAENWFAGGHS